MTLSKNDKYWTNRKINWEQSYWYDHPHRDMIINAMSGQRVKSVLEIGCGAGYNLYRIKKAFPNTEISGCDINEDAIRMAKHKLPEADLKVGSADALPFNGDSYDLVLTDALLIYIGPDKIRRVFREIRRVGYERMMFVEFHSKSFWKRFGLRLASRYYAYNYFDLLTKYYFKHIQISKIPKEVWAGPPWEQFGCIITSLR